MTVVKQIPDKLIYEMDNGKPIYYSGYRDYLSGLKPAEALMGSSILQGVIISKMVQYLSNILTNNYLVITNELGVLFSKGNWRLADIAVVERSRVKAINEKYIPVPPNVVFEIDTKAALEDYDNPDDYYALKTKRYLDFGVDKVIWIYTKNRSIEVSTLSGKEKFSWNDEVLFLDKLSFCLADIMGDLVE